MQTRPLKILLIVTAFNSLSQRVFTELRAMGHSVSVEFAVAEKTMEEAVGLFVPDLIICPYLKRMIPESIWKSVTTIIIHPGIRGDRGPCALDWAIARGVEEWGVTALQANGEMDAGDIWAHADFAMRSAPKASLYRREVSSAAVRAVKEVVSKFLGGTFIPESLDYADAGVKGRLHEPMTQADRAIDWERDTTETVIRKIHAGDSHPGVLDSFFGLECYLYGAHREASLRGAPKEVLGKRYGAICVGTVDGAVWISHLRENAPKSMKLPATFVLKKHLKGVVEQRLPLMVEEICDTFKEITFEQKGEVGYLGFYFHNGAMNSEQCVRLKYAVEAAKERGIKVLVLTGGEDFFSNGIHLNIMEDSKKKAEDGWSNIHSMNELVKALLECEGVLTVAALHGSAGAGGGFLATACDYVVARRGTVLNPHYKTMGLYGSEYWTYTLPRRVGAVKAAELTSAALPIGAQEAQTLGLIDRVLDDRSGEYQQELEVFCRGLAERDDYDELLEAKFDANDAAEAEKPLRSYREEELERMYPSFYEEDAPFHRLRHDFVYKICSAGTPKRLAVHRQEGTDA